MNRNTTLPDIQFLDAVEFKKYITKETKNRRSQRFRLFDVGFCEENRYHKGHIMGAVYLDTRRFEGRPYWNLKEVAAVSKELADLGITPTSKVALYGKDNMAPSRIALILLMLGVEQVAILDGGMPHWQVAGYEITTIPSLHEPVAPMGFGSPRFPELIIDYDRFLRDKTEKNTDTVSIRSLEEYKGHTSGYDYIRRCGHIDGAIHGGDVHDFRTHQGTSLDSQHVVAELTARGLRKDRKIIFYCGTGWRASEVLLYALVAGWYNVCLYDGGWYEWSEKQLDELAQ